MKNVTWMVSTRHEDRHSLQGRGPLGTTHARRSGDRSTACGIEATNWKMFWHLPFSSAQPDACPECCFAVCGLPSASPSLRHRTKAEKEPSA